MTWTDKRTVLRLLVLRLGDIPGGIPLRELVDQPLVSTRFMYGMIAQMQDAGEITLGYAQSPRPHGFELVSTL